ncbi:winged helix-turn-helix domain-containing protein [Haloarchaeobius sp. DFWS5]|uniref:winged helix-turn-helix domain-containing protein n=1 Tax=Haloarchaeobius sp. DFWS5 TaxID=3446114 RepID=UPI003EC019CD
MDDTFEHSDAFDALSDPTRIAIVEALVAARREDPEQPTLSFSALRDRVDVDDSGRFNYHLQKLRDRFVEKSDAGYELNYAGRQVAAAILAGTLDEAEALDPVSLDDPCPICDVPMAVEYESGQLTVTCECAHRLFQTPVPPAAAVGRTVTELLDFALDLTHGRLMLHTREVCPECYATIENGVSMLTFNDSEFYALVSTCGRCGMQSTSSLGISLLHDPDLATFYRDHGIDVRDAHPWLLGIVQAPAEEIASDPPRYRIACTVDGETFEATLDDAGQVLETRRTDAEPAADQSVH